MVGRVGPLLRVARNQVVSLILDLRALLGIVSGADASQAIKWADAASDQWDKVRGSSAEGVDVAKKPLSAKEALSSRFASRKRQVKDELNHTESPDSEIRVSDV
jgi:hypothetical protein